MKVAVTLCDSTGEVMVVINEMSSIFLTPPQDNANGSQTLYPFSICQGSQRIVLAATSAVDRLHWLGSLRRSLRGSPGASSQVAGESPSTPMDRLLSRMEHLEQSLPPSPTKGRPNIEESPDEGYDAVVARLETFLQTLSPAKALIPGIAEQDATSPASPTPTQDALYTQLATSSHAKRPSAVASLEAFLQTLSPATALIPGTAEQRATSPFPPTPAQDALDTQLATPSHAKRSSALLNRPCRGKNAERSGSPEEPPSPFPVGSKENLQRLGRPRASSACASSCSSAGSYEF